MIQRLYRKLTTQITHDWLCTQTGNLVSNVSIYNTEDSSVRSEQSWKNNDSHHFYLQKSAILDTELNFGSCWGRSLTNCSQHLINNRIEKRVEALSKSALELVLGYVWVQLSRLKFYWKTPSNIDCVSIWVEYTKYYSPIQKILAPPSNNTRTPTLQKILVLTGSGFEGLSTD